MGNAAVFSLIELSSVGLSSLTKAGLFSDLSIAWYLPAIEEEMVVEADIHLRLDSKLYFYSLNDNGIDLTEAYAIKGEG